MVRIRLHEREDKVQIWVGSWVGDQDVANGMRTNKTRDPRLSMQIGVVTIISGYELLRTTNREENAR